MTISNRIFNTQKVYGQDPMFMGQLPGFHDSIHRRYPEIYNLYKGLKVRDWDEHEVPLEQCRADFKKAPTHLVTKMLKTIAWQWEFDSIAASSTFYILAPYISDSDVKSLYQEISANETIHSASYSEIVKAGFEDPSQVMGELLTYQQSLARLGPAASIFDETLALSKTYDPLNKDPYYRKMHAVGLIKYLVALLCAERIQFTGSFKITFGIAESGWFNAPATLISKIAHDEYYYHAQAGFMVLSKLIRDSFFGPIIQELLPEIRNIIDDFVRAEVRNVTDFIFDDGLDIPGTSQNDVIRYIMFIAKDVYSLFSLNPIQDFGAVPEKDPSLFMRRWLDLSKVQSASQELRNTGYLIGGIIYDDADIIFDYNPY